VTKTSAKTSYGNLHRSFERMAESSIPDISFHSRILGLSRRELDTVRNEVPDDFCEIRVLPDGLANVSIDIALEITASELITLLNRTSLARKSDVFISLLPTSDSGIKEIPSHIVDFIAQLRCDVFVSYTFL
jgi:hypothetical protein